MKRPPLTDRILQGLEEALANVKFDEQIDTSESPDEKTNSKNKKTKAAPGSNDESSMVNWELDYTPKKRDSSQKYPKEKMPALPTDDINLGSKKSGATEQEEDSYLESNVKKKKIEVVEAAWRANKSKASDDPEEIVQENIEMSKASIKSIVKHANALMMGLNETNQTCLSEGWVQSKITIIEDYLKSVHDYVMYYEEEEEN
jgi:hypothetical protein